MSFGCLENDPRVICMHCGIVGVIKKKKKNKVNRVSAKTEFECLFIYAGNIRGIPLRKDSNRMLA